MPFFKPHLAATLAVAAIRLAGCASGPDIRADYDKSADFGKYRTYGFVTQAGKDAGDFRSLSTSRATCSASITSCSSRSSDSRHKHVE